MYSEQLESLIQSVVADGIITDKERSVLHKKAEAEGVDIDEIDVYVEGLIAQLNKEKKTEYARQYNTDVLVLEQGVGTKYYKYKDMYTSKASGDLVIGFRFADIIECSSFYGSEASLNEKYTGLCLLFSFSGKTSFSLALYHLTFKTDNKEILSLQSDMFLDASYTIGEFFTGVGHRIIQKQNIDNIETADTMGYLLNVEQLKALCDASNLQIECLDASVHDKKESIQINLLPGFQYYAQCFYRATLDPKAYPDAEKKFEEAFMKPKFKKTGGLTEQQLAGMLSRKVKGKRITPTPYYLSQYQIQNVTITEVGGRIITRRGEKEETPHVYLHAISASENDNIFYLCITDPFWNDVFRDRLLLSINLQDFELEPVTTQSSFLSDNKIHGEERYNFFYIDNNTLEKFLKSKGTTLKFIKSNNYETEYKCRSIPKKWKKAFDMLNQKDGIKKWEDGKGKFSKFLETYFHISLLQLICYTILVFIVIGLLFVLMIPIFES